MVKYSSPLSPETTVYELTQGEEAVEVIFCEKEREVKVPLEFMKDELVIRQERSLIQAFVSLFSI
jgi:hypothetical protein